ncbi:MAG: translocation/assembly module TamB domain-containing protein, partial [Moraxellaceae bacterium]
FHGDVRLTEGRLAMRRLPVQAEEVELRVAVAGDEARIDGELQSGPGTATLSGQASWRGEPTLDLALRGQRFELRQEPQLRAEISPDLRLHVVPRQIALRGNVRIPFARINLKSLPERAVNLSPDVRVLEAGTDRPLPLVARGQPWQVSTDIELLLGDDVSFEGFGLTSKLAGGLRLRQSGQRGLEAAGEVELDKEARYQAYGQNLRIRRGQLVFAGSITQPGLDVEAIREVDDVVVGIRVLGRANAPEATLFSEPAMAQEEALSYLVLGRPLVTAGGGGDNNLMLAAAAIKLGARGGAGLTSGIGNALGINDLSLDAEGSGDDTQVKVSGYLSPSLFLSYGVGVFTPVNTITLRYQIRPRLYLEALSSLENAVDLYYNLRF